MRLIPPFVRRSFGAVAPFTRIGDGAIGGKASGLWGAGEILASGFDGSRFPDVRVDVPALTVVATDVFDRVVRDPRVAEAVATGLPDDRIALAFQRADLPPEVVGDLRALVEQVRTPLAVRSSSVLEDALAHPLAGVYATKMTPNNQPDADTRFRRLVEAVKFVLASTFFEGARASRAATGASTPERMAVVIQEVVGRRHDHRFYPDVSGVGRSWNYYCTGRARPEEGVVVLALGLGKTIVDGGVAWSYSPAHPRALPPVASARALLKLTQSTFWAVNMGAAPAFDPVNEVEYLRIGTLADAEYDGTLALVAATYDPDGDRLRPGTSRPGPRAVTFAPLLDLEVLPVNAVIRALLDTFERALDGAVEIELALTADPREAPPARLGFLQVRPMSAAAETIDVSDADLADSRALVASDRVLGNGQRTLRDVVFVRPDAFSPRDSPLVAAEVSTMDRRLREIDRHYLLVGFGRWGSADPWLGIPVKWDNIGQARAIVEVQTDRMPVDPSQGAHFFHNLASLAVSYFTVAAGGRGRVDWAWLLGQPASGEGTYLRHVALAAPLSIRVDGRSGRGVILEP